VIPVWGVGLDCSEPEIEGETKTNGVGGLQVSESDILGTLVGRQRVLGSFLAARTCARGVRKMVEGSGEGLEFGVTDSKLSKVTPIVALHFEVKHLGASSVKN